MLPKTHAIIGLIFSLCLLLIPEVSLFEASLVFLASVFIDFDHYLAYIFRKKDASLRNAYIWFSRRREFMRSLIHEERKNYERIIILFHGIEFCILLALLIFVHKIFLFILIGALFHIVLDIIELLANKMPIYCKLSQIYAHKTNKNRKRLG